MRLWVDRREELPAGSPVTHALVIGVSAYRHLRDGAAPAPPDVTTFRMEQLRTPCAGSLAFARWLRDVYRNPGAPLGTIRLLLAPSPEELQDDSELAEIAPGLAPPTRANVESALWEWYYECRDDPNGVAILYASGHGMQVTREDALVLLQDFAATPAVMINTLDIGSVYHGMDGSRMPQTQWFFIDACRSSFEEIRDWENLGTGIGLRVAAVMSDRRCAPVFFSASPDTPAYGQRGKGTIFSQALLECLAGAGAEGYVDEQGRWYVSPHSLQPALERRVRDLASALGRRQDVVVGGQVRMGALHYYPDPPLVSFTLEVDPELAHQFAAADLWDFDRTAAVFLGERFHRPQLVRELPMGLYSLDVQISPPTAPYLPRSGLPCAVDPRRPYRRIPVT